MPTNTYAITASITRGVKTREHYLNYLDYISDHGEVSNVYFETKKGLHIHFTLTCPGVLDYTLAKPTKYGWSIRIVPVYNKDGWIRYCRKDHEANEDLNHTKYVKTLLVEPEDNKVPILTKSLFKRPKD